MSSERCFPRSTFIIRRTHSTFSTSLPQIHAFFPITPGFAPKYAILAHFYNRLTIRRLASEWGRLVFHTPHFARPKTIFRGSKHALSRLLLLPFASRKLSYRNSKDAPMSFPDFTCQFLPWFTIMLVNKCRLVLNGLSPLCKPYVLACQLMLNAG